MPSSTSFNPTSTRSSRSHASSYYSISSTNPELRSIGLYDHSSSSSSRNSNDNSARGIPLAKPKPTPKPKSQPRGPSNSRDQDPMETYYQSLPRSDGSFLAPPNHPCWKKEKSPRTTTATTAAVERDGFPGQSIRMLTRSFDPPAGVTTQQPAKTGEERSVQDE